jgi:hypothetical protein
MKLLMKQHVRPYPRWAHRRPLRIFYPGDLNKDEVNYAEKLKIERESIRFPTKDREYVFEEPDTTFMDKETVNNNTRPVNTSAVDVKSDVQHTVTESKLRHILVHKRDKMKLNLPNAETTLNSNLQLKSKKVRKLEAKQERKANRIKESATRVGLPVYKKLPDNDSLLR